MALSSPIQLEYLSVWEALGLFLVLALPILLLGIRSLNGLGKTRKWVSIGVRLLLMLGLVLLLAGARWQRQHTSLDVTVIRDLSDSTSYVKNLPQPTIRDSVDNWMQQAMADKRRHPDDRMGVVCFADEARIETLPQTWLDLGRRSTLSSGKGTDVGSAIQLALASLRNEAMHRLVLVWDGNATAGNLDAAVEAAAAQGVAIDVMPLRYHVDSAVMMERFIAPTYRRQNEPFTLDVVLRSTGDKPVKGRLSILHQGKPIDLDADMPGVQTEREVTLQPGITPVRVKVPPLEGGIHDFRAVFDLAPDTTVAAGQKPVLVTPSMDAFTIVQGRGSVLYVDNAPNGAGQILRDALKEEGINLQRVTLDDLPRDLMAYQNYDAVILNNVPNGAGGVDQQQDQALASYVHEMGGGLLMIGGPESFGAGGWQGSQVEKVLPVNMDIPARKEVGKGALVLVMHSCEMPDGSGNYWGEQCALKAVDALSSQDEVGVISFWSGSQWDFPLQTRNDGSKAKAAIKQMKLGDMMSFQECLDLAINGSVGQKGLKDSDARNKHVIIISDGDPAPPSNDLIDTCARNKISISTVSVYPHDLSDRGLPPNMRAIAEKLKGRAYGPINGNFNQLPQIFIKEATVVRRTLIYEDQKGIPLALRPAMSDVVQGLGSDLPPVFGMVLTSRKPDPMVDVPITAGKAADPVLAHWQSGLGKAAAFTSDAHNKWASRWVASPAYSKFWAQVVRSVARSPMSRDMDVQTRVEGDKIYITAEAMDRESHRMNFLNVSGQIVGPDMKARDIQLNQVGPGRYEAVVDKAAPGAYVTRLAYTGPKGQTGWQVAGVALNSDPEMRDLRSNDSILEQIASKTGGKLLDPFDADSADLFRREGLKQTASPMPIWDILIPILMGLLLVDVSIRRIAWDFKAIAAAIGRYTGSFRGPEVKTTESVDALRRLREGAGSTPTPQPASRPREAEAGPAPDRSRKFEGKGVAGDLTNVVGGASAQPVKKPEKPAAPSPNTPATPGDHTSGLLAAKRRARDKMDEQQP